MSAETFRLRRGGSPLIVSIPHGGTGLPREVEAALRPEMLTLTDTDWHLDRLYGFAQGYDATVLQATLSRYVIDLNRPPDGESLYPGQATTGLCPTTDFDGNPLYRPGAEPDAAEIARRRAAWWAPYHAALEAEIARVRDRHGYALLYDAHSIRSVVPRLFEGTLPDFNIGTNGGASCDPEIEERIVRICAAAPGYSHVLNGRFKGGWITRRYGRPAEGVHAMQMELAQWRYMAEEVPFGWREAGAASLGAVLRRLIEALLDWEGGAARG